MVGIGRHAPNNGYAPVVRADSTRLLVEFSVLNIEYTILIKRLDWRGFVGMGSLKGVSANR